MANLGEITEIVQSEHVTLEVGSDNYILLKDLVVNVSNTENRSPTTGAGPVYTFGQGNHSFSGTLLVSTPELSSLNTLTQADSAGAMTETSWKLVYENVSGGIRTFAATGVLRSYTVRKGTEEKAEIDIDVRITGNTITIS